MRNLIRRPLGLFLAAALMFGLSAPTMAAESANVTATVTITGCENNRIPAGSTKELTASFTLPDSYQDYEISDVSWTWSSDDRDENYVDIGNSELQDDHSSVVPVSMDSSLTYNSSVRVAITASVAMTLTPKTADSGNDSDNSSDTPSTVSDGSSASSVTASGSTTINVLPDFAVATDVSILSSSGSFVTSTTVEVGGKATLKATVSPSYNANQNNLTWSLKEESGDSVIRLSANTGNYVDITALAPGKTTLVVRVSDNASLKDECIITVPGIVLSDSSISLTVGESGILQATPYGNIGTSVTWSSNNMSVVQVGSTGELSAISAGTAVVTATIGEYSTTCNVTVAENTATSILQDLSAGQPLDFENLMAQLNSISQDAGSAPLNYITNLSVATDEGILYYGYSSNDSTGLGVGVSEMYYYSPKTAQGQRGIADLTFVPKTGFTGTAVISYTGYSDSNISFTGQIRLTVESTSDIIYTTSLNTPVEFDPSDFNEICRTQTSRSLSYVTFDLPASSRGTLYYNYSGVGLYSEPVTRNTPYYVSSSPKLSKVTFVPAEDYSGTVRISYTGVDNSGQTYTDQISITVSGGGSSGYEISYQVNPSGYVDFKASDFNSYCYSVNGSTLSYVRFTLPDSSKGSLYYNYSSNGSYDSAVAQDTKYYYSTKPSISNVSFVAGNSFTTSLAIDFVGYDTSGNRFTGKVYVEPSETVYEGTGDIFYTARSGQSVTFDAADFNEISLDCTGERLNYVQFDLPASSRGILYYNYSASSSTKTKVSESYKYYRNSYRYLSQVTFVPASGSSGTTAINFTGYDVEGTSFTGTVWIETTDSSVETMHYSVTSGGAISFDVSDFNTACRELTGAALSYVRFALPTSDKGILCYQYDGSTGKYASKATATTSYYRTSTSTNSSTRLLGNVFFLADAQYSGTVEIEYTGWSTDNTKFTGKLKITVTEPVAENIRYTGSSTPISLRSSDFNELCNDLFHSDLASIRFTSLPDQAAGRLYLNYVSPTSTGSTVSTGRSYDRSALGGIVFLPKAEFQGSVTASYTGTDTAGATFTGTVTFVVSNDYCANSFTDMGSFTWAKPSVEFLAEYDIVNGVGGSSFGPSQYIRRGDFVLMLCRAFGFNTGSTSSFSDVPADSYYAWAIATAKDLGIVQGSGGLFLPQSILTRQDAMVMIKRAMSAAGINVSNASTYLLSYYTDGDQVQSYARDAVVTLVQAGVVNGTDSGALMPLNPIRRAEMAIILHRVLTM